MTNLAHLAQITARVIFEDHSKMNPMVKIFFDGFDHRSLAFEICIEDVGPVARTKTDAIASPEFGSCNGCACYRLIIEGVPRGPWITLSGAHSADGAVQLK